MSSEKVSSESPKETPIKSVSPSDTSNSTPSSAKYEGIKMLGILHFIGNIVSGGTLWLVLVLIYLLVRKDELTSEEKNTCYEIMNFNISFILYSCISGIFMLILIGFLLLAIVYIIGLILLVIGFTKHLNGENYRYPGIIRFVK